MTSDAILAELRGLPGAPETLRERVLALPEPQPRVAWSLPRLDLRRFVLVATPAVLALGLGAAALHGLRAGGSSPEFAAIERTPPASSTRELAPGAAHGGAAFGANAGVSPQALKALPPSSTRLSRALKRLEELMSDDE